MTQIQLLFDQERKSLKPGDTELLKRVIRSEEGTLTGYIKGLESQLNLNFGNENETATEETETISANFINNSFSSNANIETPNTLN
jgi:hypothetical protein